jgi:hypothetical protein
VEHKDTTNWLLPLLLGLAPLRIQCNEMGKDLEDPLYGVLELYVISQCDTIGFFGRKSFLFTKSLFSPGRPDGRLCGTKDILDSSLDATSLFSYH